jgi:hypothetical protein
VPAKGFAPSSLLLVRSPQPYASMSSQCGPVSGLDQISLNRRRQESDTKHHNFVLHVHHELLSLATPVDQNLQDNCCRPKEPDAEPHGDSHDALELDLDNENALDSGLIEIANPHSIIMVAPQGCQTIGLNLDACIVCGFPEMGMDLVSEPDSLATERRLAPARSHRAAAKRPTWLTASFHRGKHRMWQRRFRRRKVELKF